MLDKRRWRSYKNRPLPIALTPTGQKGWPWLRNAKIWSGPGEINCSMYHLGKRHEVALLWSHSSKCSRELCRQLPSPVAFPTTRGRGASHRSSLPAGSSTGLLSPDHDCQLPAASSQNNVLALLVILFSPLGHGDFALRLLEQSTQKSEQGEES